MTMLNRWDSLFGRGLIDLEVVLANGLLAENLHKSERMNRFLDSDEDRGHVCNRCVCYRNEFIIT